MAVLVAVSALRIPLIHAQGPTPGIGPFNVTSYRPYAYFSSGDTPSQVLWNATCQYVTCDIGQIAYTFWFYWPTHPFTIPAQNTTWEPVYVYVSIGTANTSQVAYRGFHYLWTAISNMTLLTPTQRPVFTFSGLYHQPRPSFPAAGGSFSPYQQVEYNYTEVPLANYSLTDPTPPFNLPNYAYLQLVPYVELATINTVAIAAAWLLLHTHVRRKHP